jgi:hypothetical protein
MGSSGRGVQVADTPEDLDVGGGGGSGVEESQVGLCG